MPVERFLRNRVRGNLEDVMQPPWRTPLGNLFFECYALLPSRCPDSANALAIHGRPDRLRQADQMDKCGAKFIRPNIANGCQLAEHDFRGGVDHNRCSYAVL